MQQAEEDLLDKFIAQSTADVEVRVFYTFVFTLSKFYWVFPELCYRACVMSGLWWPV